MLSLLFLFSLRGTGFLSGHADGSVYRIYIADDPFAEQQVDMIFIIQHIFIFQFVKLYILKESLNFRFGFLNKLNN